MERERRMEAQDAAERERMTVASLRRELELQRDTSRTTDVKSKAKIAELKSALDMERAKSEEVNRLDKIYTNSLYMYNEIVSNRSYPNRFLILKHITVMVLTMFY